MSKKFSFKQKVSCIYHYIIYCNMPVLGWIICKLPLRKKHHFSKEKDGKCNWYLVLTKNFIPIIIPETCIDDLKDSINDDKQWFDTYQPSEKELLDPNYSINVLTLKSWQKDKINFLGELI